MRRLTFALLALILGAGAALAAPVELRPHAMVRDPVVRLGDLFHVGDEKAGLAIGYAPAIGHRKVYDAARLVELARAYQLDWRPRSRFDRVVVERESRAVESDVILAALRRALAARGVAGDHEIVLDQRRLVLQISPEAAPTVAVRGLRYDAAAGRFTAEVAAPADGAQATAQVSGRVYRMVEIPVPVRRLDRGHVIEDGDIGWLRVRAERLSRDVVTDAAGVLGMAPRRALRPDEPIRHADVQPPVVVAKGSLVTLMLRTRFMTLTVRARALENGARDAAIRVMNTHSRMVVEGTVVAPDMVVVELARAFAELEE